MIELQSKMHEIQMHLLYEMSYMKSLRDMRDLFVNNMQFLGGFTFLVTTEDGFQTTLDAGREEYAAINSKIFTPFADDKISVISNGILDRAVRKNDPLIKVMKVISFDTQAISYVEQYYHKGAVPYEAFEELIRLIGESGVGIDYIPYVMENLMNDTKRETSVERTIFAFEMLCPENNQNEIKCRRKAQDIIALYKYAGDKRLAFVRELYKSVYLVLLKMCLIQMTLVDTSIDRKMEELTYFMAEKLCRMMYPELILAKKLFKFGNSCGFFGKIHKGNTEIIKSIKNMAWDLMHLRFVDYGCAVFDAKKVDLILPYFLTYDKKLLEIKSCYDLRALAVDPVQCIAIPFYKYEKQVIPYVKEYSTMNKHMMRSRCQGNTDLLIREVEEALISFVNG